MKNLFIVLTIGLAGCGTSGPEQPASAAEYTRFVAQPTDLDPGQEGIWCQWVTGPAEADIDIADITGEQRFPGHHAILLSTAVNEPLGTIRPCTVNDNADMKIIGGVGGEGTATTFPTGAVVRLKKGESLVMNTHYLNTSDKKVTGESVLDVKFEEPSPDHIVASYFFNLGFEFSLTPQSESSADISCTLPQDLKLIDFANHMHDLGVKVRSEVVHADGTTEDLRRDETWQSEWQYNPPRQTWSVDAPYTLKAGETIHTFCTWKNPTPDTLAFPREMCLGSGFFIGENSVGCVDKAWTE